MSRTLCSSHKPISMHISETHHKKTSRLPCYFILCWNKVIESNILSKVLARVSKSFYHIKYIKKTEMKVSLCLFKFCTITWLKHYQEGKHHDYEFNVNSSVTKDGYKGTWIVLSDYYTHSFYLSRKRNSMHLVMTQSHQSYRNLNKMYKYQLPQSH